MSLTLKPLPPEQFQTWLQRSTAEYTSDLITLGNTPQQAQDFAQKAMTEAFPTNQPTPTHAVFTLFHAGKEDVGYLWIGRDTSGDPSSWWVWDILVEPEYRSRGFGKQAMKLAESYARTHDACSLGLNVFGFNHNARGLYEALGYETTSVKMRKKL